MPQWTSDQRRAIEDRGGQTLVSAAAGSGKTAVLVERVLRRLTDERDPVDIDRLLLMTFTSAAASEMRERIAAAIAEAAAARPADTRLRRQLFLTHRAQITTVHALCQRLAREQAAALGIAPDFRVLDEQEGKLLRAEVLEDVLEAAYEREDAGFFALSDLLSAGRDDARLAETVLATHEKIQAHPDPRAFLETVRRGLYAGDMHTPHARVLLGLSREAAMHGAAFLRQAVEELQGIDQLQDAYLPALVSDLKQAQALIAAIDSDGWDAAVAAAQQITFDRLKAARGFEDKAFLEHIKALREEWKAAAKTVSGKWLTVHTDDAVYDRSLIAPAMNALIDTVNGFDEAFAAAKRSRNAADFNDLEHFAVRLLLTDGAPSELALSLRGRYAEILVDEYQDTNAVQDAIFGALSQEGRNLFMVGDVKQSIYGFRLADPSIFLTKYRAFADAAQAEQGAPRRIVLGQNFRSRAAVLDACNFIFSAVMGDTVGGLNYTEQEALYLGAAYPEPDAARYKTEVLLADAAGAGEDDDAEDKTVLEARLAARRIRALLDECFPVLDKETGNLRPVSPGDVVILLRSPRTKARAYIDALEAYGVAATAETRGGLLETSEVSLMVSLLSVIDNPRQDVELIGVMRSPLFGFTEQHLADIRLLDRTASFYDAVCLAAADDADCAAFLSRLAAWRDYACDAPVCRLIWQLYQDTGALGFAAAQPNGVQRRQNLYAFFERARAFETEGSRGLFAFVRRLRGMLETGEDYQRVDAAASGGMVRVMSIHKSKGLEFPVVLLADCAKRFNESDLRQAVLVHSELGFGCKCRDTERGVQYDTAERAAVAAAQRREMVSEELRVLYVAMTRAKEKLIITCASGTLEANLQKWALLAALPSLPQYAMGTARAPLAWLIAPLLRHPCTRGLREQYGLCVPETAGAPDAFSVRVIPAAELTPPSGPEVLRFTASEGQMPKVPPAKPYPQAFLAELPSKLTATGIGRGYRAAEAAEQTPAPQREKQLRVPLFEAGRVQLSPAEIGTAHHLFLQFCDFETAKRPGGIERELQRLRERAILSPAQADAVDTGKIARFFESPLFCKTILNGRLRREFKFSVLVPAARYWPQAQAAPEERVLLQGVIDCLIETDEGFVLIDFKTDRVAADRVPARAERYRSQMDAYALAVDTIFHRSVTGKILYFLDNGMEYSLN